MLTPPFTREQFFDVFRAYNEALWPAAVALWLGGMAVAVTHWRGRGDHRTFGALAVLWAWSAIAYHAAYFTRVNPAAWLFASLFLVEAALLAHEALVARRLRFASRGTIWSYAGWSLLAYALAYPALASVGHVTRWHAPTFGVPCPTTLFTAGVLLLTTSGSWRLSIIPVLWSLIGGTAAVLWHVRADLVLPIAGFVLTTFSLATYATDLDASARSTRPRGM
jgi:hypothetical protein